MSTVKTKPIPVEKAFGVWQCSGCLFRTDGPIGACKGYCFDASGGSCDAVACPRCGKFHYWTGSITFAEQRACGAIEPVTRSACVIIGPHTTHLGDGTTWASQSAVIVLYRVVEGPRGKWQLHQAIQVPDDGENGGIEWRETGREVEVVPMPMDRRRSATKTRWEGATIRQGAAGEVVVEPIGDEPLSDDVKRAVADLIRERTPEERELSRRLYNEAAERLWCKLLAHKDELRPAAEAGWSAFRRVNPIAQRLADEVDAELNYELSYAQCSWSVGMYQQYAPEDYFKETGVVIEARP